MEIPVTKRLEVPDGLHKGAIVGVEYRTEPHSYTDVQIEFPVDDTVIKLKVGYPTTVSEASRLGKLIQRFGVDLTVGQQIDPEKVLVGRKCQFQTITQQTANGVFARIIPESVKPE